MSYRPGRETKAGATDQGGMTKAGATDQGGMTKAGAKYLLFQLPRRLTARLSQLRLCHACHVPKMKLTTPDQWGVCVYVCV